MSDNIEATGVDQSVVMTANENTGKLPDFIDMLFESVDWTVAVTAAEPEFAMPPLHTEHTIHLTYGTPYPATDNTNYRLMHLEEWAEGGSSEEEISDAIGPEAVDGSSEEVFNYEYSIGDDVEEPYHIDPIWEIRETGGDCISQVTFMEAALQLLGVPGGEVGLVHPRHDQWNGLWNQSYVPETDGVGNRLVYMNNGNGNKFEACFRIGGKYWMGGTGSSETKAVLVLYSVAGPRDLSNDQKYQCYINAITAKVAFPAEADPEY